MFAATYNVADHRAECKGGYVMETSVEYDDCSGEFTRCIVHVESPQLLLALAVGDPKPEGVRVPFTLSNRSRSAKEVGHPAVLLS